MPIVLPVDEGGVTKSTLIEMAYGQCGIAGYEFGHTAEEITAALILMNAMMYESPWDALGYVQPLSGIGDPQEASGVPGGATTAVAFTLANRICSTKGKVLSVSQQAEMTRTRNLIASEYASVVTMPRSYDTLRGAGNIYSKFDPFYRETA